MGNVCRYQNWTQYPNQSDYHGLISKCEDMKKDEVMRNRIKFWSDREIRAAFDKRGGKYKGILQQLIMERDYAYQRQIRYYVNVDIDKIMRRLS